MSATGNKHTRVSGGCQWLTAQLGFSHCCCYSVPWLKTCGKYFPSELDTVTTGSSVTQVMPRFNGTCSPYFSPQFSTVAGHAFHIATRHNALMGVCTYIWHIYTYIYLDSYIIHSCIQQQKKISDPKIFGRRIRDECGHAVDRIHKRTLCEHDHEDCLLHQKKGEKALTKPILRQF
ncbi:hypothetical protein Pelo_16620 [Pelomyxa schiedti]|nr:hypothetical protein Pelo_16620 [Pelomyxa schiedti]